MGEPNRQARILTIDDCPMVHRLLQHHLRHESAELHIAGSAAEGLALARSLQPDVVLLDIDLGESGDLDGFEILARLKSDEATSDAAVIFLSASASTEARVRGLDLGAIDFVAKPFEAAELRARVRSALRIRQLVRMLAQKARIDGLSGLWNRAYFDRRLEEEVSECRRYGRPVTLILADIDHFKRINDEFGHPVGDTVIERFASILSTGRASDVPCRYGGEEFALILPGVSSAAAIEVAERIRRCLSEERWSGHDRLQVTASFGIADLQCCGPDADASKIVEAADEALYRAKSAGRDRVYAVASQWPRRTA